MKKIIAPMFLMLVMILILTSSISVFAAKKDNSDVSAVFQKEIDFVQSSQLISDTDKLKKIVTVYFDLKSLNDKLSNDLDFSFLEYKTSNTSKNFDYISDKTKYFKELRKGLDVTVLWDNLDVKIDDVKINDDNTAAVKAYENYEFILDDGSNTLSTSGINYIINFIKIDGKWLITNISSDDEFDRANFNKVFDVSQKLKDSLSSNVPQPLNAENLEKEQSYQNNLINESNIIDNITIMPNLTSVSYDKNKFTIYAWSNTEDSGDNTTDWYSTLFDQYSPNDCQNFASQCIWYGFGGSYDANSITSKLFPMIASGTRAWYQAGPGGGVDSYGRWWNCENFGDYISTSGSSVQGPYGWINTNNLSYAEVGDTIQLYEDGSYYHTYVVDQVSGTSGSRTNSQIWVSAHTSNRKSHRLDLLIGSSQNNTRNIRITTYYK
jgi:hypothetical protein